MFTPEDYIVVFDVPALALKFNVGERVVRQWITAGELPAKKIGRSYFVTRASVKQFVQPEGGHLQFDSRAELHSLGGFLSQRLQRHVTIDKIANRLYIYETPEPAASISEVELLALGDRDTILDELERRMATSS